MGVVKICAAVVVGFALGAWFYHPITAKAASGSGTVYVIKATEGAVTNPIIANREIIGFSCTEGAMGGECYLAVRQ